MSGEQSAGEALMAQGRAAFEAGRLDDAAQAFRAAVDGVADRSRPWNNLGVVLRAQGHLEAAMACYGRALAYDPESAETWGNLANGQRTLHQFDLAEANLRRAIALDPDDPDYVCNLGIAQLGAGRPDEALASFEAALAAAPDSPRFRFQRGCALLHLGRYASAWADVEQRYAVGMVSVRHEGTPLWDGRALDGETVLIYAEQGHGDMLQFARFLPAAIDRAGRRVVLEVHPSLRRLFEANFPGLPVCSVGETPPSHDLRVPLLSVPYALNLPDSAIAMAEPYVQAPSGSAGKVPPSNARLRVGLTWSGNPSPWDRSCPFEKLLPLLAVPDVDFYSLQRGEPAGDIARCGASTLVTDLTPQLSDFADDAAVIEQLDLVITIDTAVAHLAGAMGKPVWILMTYVSDWRFPFGHETCDWYPSLRLFRQPSPGDWRPVIDDAAAALADLTG